MKRSIWNFLFLSAIAYAMTSCGGGGKSYEEDASSEEMAEEVVEPVTYSKETAMGILHSVEDVDKWVSVYEEASTPEARLGYVQSVDNPNTLFVFQWTTGHEDAMNMVESEEMKANMENAGVNSEAEVTYYDMKFYNPDAPEGMMYRVAASHEVEDFDTWREGFDAHEDARMEAGMVLTGMATDAQNPNKVYMMFATSDMEKVKEMMGSEEMKTTMKEAGVKGEPEVTFWKVISPSDGGS